MKKLILIGLLVSGAVASDKTREDKEAEYIAYNIAYKICKCYINTMIATNYSNDELTTQQCTSVMKANTTKEQHKLLNDYVNKYGESALEKYALQGTESCKIAYENGIFGDSK